LVPSGLRHELQILFHGHQGFKRNLKTHEIIGQVLKAKEVLKQEGEKRDVVNIVFMGQGEPLHNFDSLKKAVAILTEPNGLGLGKRNITVSTSGYLPGLKRFEELGGINLALSLHSTNDEVRSRLIPINNRYPLIDVLKQIDSLALHQRQTVEYEYLLIKDVNDTFEDAKSLARLLASRNHMINIIPFNPFPGSNLERPAEERVKEFKQWLVEENAMVMVRKTKGDDILAACGQLKS
ncbi:MAG: radical SAM protein, partial [Bacteriovoracaceae bacterium]